MSAVLVKGIALLTAGLLAGVVVAVLMADRRADEAPRGPVVGSGTAVSTAASMATPTDTPVAVGAQEPQLFVSQVVGMRGYDQPIFVGAIGEALAGRLRLERMDDGQSVALVTSEHGFASIDGRVLFERSCAPGVRCPLRLVEEESGRELATSRFEVPVFPGTIEVEPPSGGAGRSW